MLTIFYVVDIELEQYRKTLLSREGKLEKRQYVVIKDSK